MSDGLKSLKCDSGRTTARTEDSFSMAFQSVTLRHSRSLWTSPKRRSQSRKRSLRKKKLWKEKKKKEKKAKATKTQNKEGKRLPRSLKKKSLQ